MQENYGIYAGHRLNTNFYVKMSTNGHMTNYKLIFQITAYQIKVDVQ